MKSAVDIDPARMAAAARTIDPVFRDSPQYGDPCLDAALGRRVMVKVETANPIGSFKGRGADHLVRRFAPGQRVSCLTSGNFGQAVAYAGRRHGLDVRVYVTADVNPIKRARMEAFGATVTIVEDTAAALDDHAVRPDETLIDGTEPEIAEGAGTIGVELQATTDLDAVVVPVGSGALAAGVACWFKANAPHVRIVGACAAGSPAMAESWRVGHVVTGPTTTVAEGIATARPEIVSVRRLRALLNDVVLVQDDAILDAAALVAGTLGVLVEPTGAVGVAALAMSDVPGRLVATVLTGANPHPDMLPTILRRLPGHVQR